MNQKSPKYETGLLCNLPGNFLNSLEKINFSEGESISAVIACFAN
jgi:hypothetical protein